MITSSLISSPCSVRMLVCGTNRASGCTSAVKACSHPVLGRLRALRVPAGCSRAWRLVGLAHRLCGGSTGRRPTFPMRIGMTGRCSAKPLSRLRVSCSLLRGLPDGLGGRKHGPRVEHRESSRRARGGDESSRIVAGSGDLDEEIDAIQRGDVGLAPFDEADRRGVQRVSEPELEDLVRTSEPIEVGVDESRRGLVLLDDREARARAGSRRWSGNSSKVHSDPGSLKTQIHSPLKSATPDP